MKRDRLFVRKYSLEGGTTSEGEIETPIGKDRLEEIRIELTKSYYQGRIIADHIVGDKRETDYLTSGGVLRVSREGDKTKLLEIMTESAQGLASMSEHLGLPLEKDRVLGKPIPYRLINEEQ